MLYTDALQMLLEGLKPCVHQESVVILVVQVKPPPAVFSLVAVENVLFSLKSWEEYQKHVTVFLLYF